MFENENSPNPNLSSQGRKEQVVETKTCRHCGESFDITDKDLEFYEKVSPVFNSPSPSDIPLNGGGTKGGVIKLKNGKIKYFISTPTLCPDCRQQRRLSFRNERKLYKRKCDFSGREIISIYSPDKPYKVYDQEIWWSDAWGALDYGREFDFNKSFFEQIRELFKNVPLMSTMNSYSINSNYSNRVVNMKDTYFVYRGHDVENCMYALGVAFDTNCIDITISKNCESCFELLDCRNCYKVFYSSNTIDCNDSFFLDTCVGCSYCFCCSNLVNKKYYIFNKKYSPGEYKKEIKKFQISDYSQFKKVKNLFKLYALKFPKKANFSVNSLSSSGEYLVNSKNSFFCYDSTWLEDCKYIFYGVDGVKNSYDCNFIGRNSEVSYELLSCIGYLNLFSVFMMNCNNMLYAINCHSCNNCFGCVGLRNKSYCILNKEYSKEEYEILVPQIIEHMSSPQPSPEGEGVREWGEFFPSSLSPFGYNETVAQEYYPINPPVLRDIPLNKGDSQNGVEAGGLSYIDREGNTYKTLEEAEKRPFFKWSTYEAPFPKVEKIIPASKLPDDISKIPDDILNWAIECEVTKKPFRIIKEELEFYRKHNLPLPRKHPDQRHLDRMSLRNPRKLYTRKCDKCGKEIQTTYAPERPEIVYCEECYNKEVY